MSKLLLETAAAPVKVGNRWRTIVAKPGQGSSGFYSETMLKEFGPIAFAPGAKAFINHDPDRNPKDMIGTYPDGAVYEEGVGLVAELEVFSHWKDFVEEVGPHAGLSIYMLGESDEQGNVTSLIPDRQNGADLVGYAGLEGSGLAEKLYESAKQRLVKENTDSTSASDKQKENMDEKILLALEALIAKFDTFITESAAKATASEESKVDAVKAVDAFESAVKSIDAAELLPSQVASLRAEAKTGTDVAPLIESAKLIRDEALAAVGTHGRIVESGAGTATLADLTVSGWKN